MVDLDADCLEAALCRMASVPAGSRRDTGLDGIDEISRGDERALLPAAHDLARDLAGELLLPIDAKNPGEVGFGIGVQDLSCV